MKVIVPILAVAMLLLSRGKPAPKAAAADHRSQVAAWLAYYAVNTPTPVPKPTPKVETPKTVPVKPPTKPQLNTFGLPVGVPPKP